jgi:hypothetical protein
MARTTRGLHGARAAPLPFQQTMNGMWNDERDSSDVAACTAPSHNNVAHLHAANSDIKEEPNFKDHSFVRSSKGHPTKGLGVWQVSSANGHPLVCAAAAISDHCAQRQCFPTLIFV